MYAAAVARRLQSLGALTRGDRRAASGIDLSESNFDSPLGRKSLRRMYDAIVQASPSLPAGVTLTSILGDCLRDGGAILQKVLDQLPNSGTVDTAQQVPAGTHKDVHACMHAHMQTRTPACLHACMRHGSQRSATPLGTPTAAASVSCGHQAPTHARAYSRHDSSSEMAGNWSQQWGSGWG